MPPKNIKKVRQSKCVLGITNGPQPKKPWVVMKREIWNAFWTSWFSSHKPHKPADAMLFSKTYRWDLVSILNTASKKILASMSCWKFTSHFYDLLAHTISLVTEFIIRSLEGPNSCWAQLLYASTDPLPIPRPSQINSDVETPTKRNTSRPPGLRRPLLSLRSLREITKLQTSSSFAK